MKELANLKNGFPRFQDLYFVRDSGFILRQSYVRSQFHDLAEINQGDFALSVKKNRHFLWFENKTFDGLRSLKRLGSVDPERLPFHTGFYDILIKEAIRILERLNTSKEVEWNTLQYNARQRITETDVPTVDTSSSADDSCDILFLLMLS